MKHKTKNKTLIFLIAAACLLLCLAGCQKNGSSAKDSDTNNQTNPPIYYPTDNEIKPSDPLDPYGLSFSASALCFDSDLRVRLCHSELEFCSYVTEGEDPIDLTLTWNLKSSGREVYRCDYSFDKNKAYSQRSTAACQIGEAYQEYLDGDKALIRDYVMPEKDDGIDMFVYEKKSLYYEQHFILGKYSDMKCSIEGDDILFEYSWYQKTEDGPVLVYRSTARNTTTTSGKRYNEQLWELFEESYRNIDIVPYEEFPREKDYYEVYHQWENREKEKREEERIAELIDIYCACQDEDDLYSEYADHFDSWEDAYDFWESYCE